MRFFFLLSALALGCLLPRVMAANVQPASAAGDTARTVWAMGGDADYHPFEYLNENGDPVGFNVDLTRLIAHRTGMKMKLTLGPWSQKRQALERGEIDGLIGLCYSRERAARVDFSIPYLTIHHCAFGLKGGRLLSKSPDLAGWEVIVQRGDIMHDYALKQFPKARLIIVETPLDGLRMLAEGKHDCMLIGRLQAVYLKNKHNLTRLTALGPPLLETKVCFAVRKGNSALLAKINDGLSIVNANGEYKIIYEKWLGMLEPSLWEISCLLRTATIVTCVLAALLALAMVWTWLLRRKVGQATRKLHHELAERRNAEAALRDSEQRYRLLVNNIDLGIVSISDDFRILTCNDTMNRLFKPELERLEARVCHQCFALSGQICPDCPGVQAMATGVPVEVETERTGNHGQSYTVRLRAFPQYHADGRPAGFIELVEDITQRRRLEAQVRHTQKLESLGILAGGIAHDFNNLLMSILGNADLALLGQPEGAVVARIEEIKRASLRASDLTRQMLAYSGRGRFVIERIDLNAQVEEMAQLLQVSISKKVALQYRLTEPLPALAGDAAQIRQVIMNLITNAAEAIGDHAGSISLATGTAWLDGAATEQMYLQDGLDQGHYVFIEVSDTGGGMDETTKARIFDPFFTTKFTGRGLGLAAVLGIIRGHNGTIQIQSEPGKGTMFKVFFPYSDDPQGASESPANPQSGEWVGSGVILVVDDEDMVRDVAQMMLESFGFTVLLACDGVEGVKAVQDNPGIDAVLLDLTMPKMNGEETFREMHKLRPELPVILVSGYNEQEVTDQFLGKGIAGFIQKPFQLMELMDKLRQALEQRGK